MKSKFAKFVDMTLGAVLIFCAATAVLRYYTTLYIATFCALAITSCAVVLLRFTSKKRTDKLNLSKAADDMFFNFMFENDSAPARLMCRALKDKGVGAVTHGNGVYTNGLAAFFIFDAPLDSKTAARLIAKASHYGAKSAIVFCKLPPASTVDVDEFDLKTVCGEDVYKLFASLGALPQKREHKKPRRFAALRGALGKDKTVRYLLLAAAMFAISIPLRSPIPFVCACLCSLLFVASLSASAIKSFRKSQAKKRSEK